MKVSVSIITYNHEKYIAQAIDSVLMQRTNFDYEIIIGEDDSQDNTRAIVKEYKKHYPDKIRLFLNDRKNVIYINRRPTGRWNFINNLKHARGKYIALLEGDDYWTDPYKLQKQVDLLDDHPEYAFCFHSVQMIYEDEDKEPLTFKPSRQKKVYTIEDLLTGNFIASGSVVYRNELICEFPGWFRKTPVGDWPLYILNSLHGDIGYIDEAMEVYRIHSCGLWQSQDGIQQNLTDIQTYRILYNQLDHRYAKLIKQRISHRYYNMARLYQRKCNRPKALMNLFKCLMASPGKPAAPHHQLLRDTLSLLFPTVYRVLRLIRKRIASV